MSHNRRFFVREPFSGLSHGLGAFLSVAALIVLLVLARGHVWPTVAFGLYGASLVLLYTVSTLYHSLWIEEERLDRLQRLDHIAIFLFIAGAYAPLCLVSLHGPRGWTLFGAECLLALIGILSSRPGRGLPDWVRVCLYGVMGWLALFALAPLRHALSPSGFGWLLASGLAYTLGAVIFALDKPHLWPGKFNAHDLWHLFVLAGTLCHFVVLVRYVVPNA